MPPRRSIVPCLLIAFLLTACGDELTAPTDDPDYIGYIVDMSVNSAFVRALDDPCGILLTLRPDTYYGASGQPVERFQLTPGLQANVWVSGPISESCPQQAAARALTVD